MPTATRTEALAALRPLSWYICSRLVPAPEAPQEDETGGALEAAPNPPQNARKPHLSPIQADGPSRLAPGDYGSGPCDGCGKPIHRVRPWSRFCGSRCRAAYRRAHARVSCPGCGRRFDVGRAIGPS